MPVHDERGRRIVLWDRDRGHREDMKINIERSRDTRKHMYHQLACGTAVRVEKHSVHSARLGVSTVPLEFHPTVLLLDSESDSDGWFETPITCCILLCVACLPRRLDQGNLDPRRGMLMIKLRITAL